MNIMDMEQDLGSLHDPDPGSPGQNILEKVTFFRWRVHEVWLDLINTWNKYEVWFPFAN